MYDELVKDLRKMQSVEYCVITSIESFPAIKIVDEAADAIEELQKALEAVNDAHNEGYDVGYWAGRRDYEPKWIPVTERLPEDDTVCILTNGVSDAIGYRGKVFGWHLIWTDYLVESEVTHWMPLPEPPGEERKDPCADCIHYPPSSTDGKPCCACDPENPLTNCHEAKEKT